MTPRLPGPYFVKLEYVAGGLPHVAIIPTGTWNDLGGTGGHGQFEAWDSSNVDAVTMVTGLVDKLLPFYDPGVTFESWTVYNQNEPTDQPVPLDGALFTSKVGTNDSDSWGACVQYTLTWRDTGFHLFKQTLLEAASGNDFTPVTVLGAPITDLNTVVTDMGNAWSSRWGLRPATFIRGTKTLNEKLRRARRFT